MNESPRLGAVVDLDRDLESMDADELNAYADDLLEERDELNDQAEGIRRQLGWAKSRVHMGGPHADPEWFRRAEDALSHKEAMVRRLNRHLMRVQRRQGVIKRAELDAKDRRRERLFIEAARNVLPRETFLSLWTMVDQLDMAR